MRNIDTKHMDFKERELNIKDEKTCRFWIYHNSSFVKITLRPGQKITLVEGGQTEEGYDTTYTDYTHEGPIIVRGTHRYARDCDGPFEWHYECTCIVQNLKSIELKCDDGDVIRSPGWKQVSCYQRDYYAERMGY